MAPAVATPHAKACPGVSNDRAAKPRKTIKVRFSKIGVAATAAKRPTLLRIPPANETKLMNNRYGKVSRVSVTVRSN